MTAIPRGTQCFEMARNGISIAAQLSAPDRYQNPPSMMEIVLTDTARFTFTRVSDAEQTFPIPRTRGIVDPTLEYPLPTQLPMQLASTSSNESSWLGLGTTPYAHLPRSITAVAPPRPASERDDVDVGTSIYQPPINKVQHWFIEFLIQKGHPDYPQYGINNDRPPRLIIDTGSRQLWSWKADNPFYLKHTSVGNPPQDYYNVDPAPKELVRRGYHNHYTEDALIARGAPKTYPVSDRFVQLAHYGSDNAVVGQFHSSTLWFRCAGDQQSNGREFWYDIPSMETGHALGGTPGLIAGKGEGILGLIPDHKVTPRDPDNYNDNTVERISFLEHAAMATARLRDPSFHFELYPHLHSSQSRFMIGVLPTSDYQYIDWYPVSMLGNSGKVRAWTIEVDSIEFQGRKFQLTGPQRHFLCDTGAFNTYAPEDILDAIYLDILRGYKNVPDDIYHFLHQYSHASYGTMSWENMVLRLNPADNKYGARPIMINLAGLSCLTRGRRQSTKNGHEYVCSIVQKKGTHGRLTPYVSKTFPWCILGMAFLESHAMFFDGRERRIGFAPRRNTSSWEAKKWRFAGREI